jgi:prephenate dehydratase
MSIKKQNLHTKGKRLMPVAYQGMLGSYSQQAIDEFAKKHDIALKPVSTHDFKELFDAIVGKTGLGLVPIENSNAGSVVDCYDKFLDYDVEIIGEYILKINHCLLGTSGTKIRDISRVYSHPQALSQCSDFLEDHRFTTIPVLDTAGSAKKLSESKEEGSAAIASAYAAEYYGLTILKRNLQNIEENFTRFLLVKRKGKQYGFERELPPDDKSTVMFETRNIPAALYKCLGGFATNEVNLLKIESRPKRWGKGFEPIFYVDFEGDLNDRGVQQALSELDFFSEQVAYLGSYPKHQ